MLRVIDAAFMAALSFSILTGCSTQSAKTVETEKTVRYASPSEPAPTDPVVERKTTKTEETTKTDAQSVGLLGGTVHVVGQAIALPFRAVGGLVELVF